MLDAKGSPVLIVDAMEGSPLQYAVCWIALPTKGRSRHLAFCAGRGTQPRGACAKYVRKMPSATYRHMLAKLSRQCRIIIAALCMVQEIFSTWLWPKSSLTTAAVGHEALQACIRAAARRRRHRKDLLIDDLGCRGHAGAHDRCDGGLAAPECGLLCRTAYERPLEAPCLLCLMTACSWRRHKGRPS